MTHRTIFATQVRAATWLAAIGLLAAGCTISSTPSGDPIGTSSTSSTTTNPPTKITSAPGRSTTTSTLSPRSKLLISEAEQRLLVFGDRLGPEPGTTTIEAAAADWGCVGESLPIPVNTNPDKPSSDPPNVWGYIDLEIQTFNDARVALMALFESDLGFPPYQLAAVNLDTCEILVWIGDAAYQRGTP